MCNERLQPFLLRWKIDVEVEKRGTMIELKNFGYNLE